MTDLERSYARASTVRLVLLAVGLFMVATNAVVIAGLLPEIADTLRVHPSDVSYSITAYSLIVAILAPVISITLTRLSRTTLMAVGLVIVAAGTVVAASALTLEVFTLGRVIAAIGGAALVPTATASAAMMATPERRGRAIGIVAAGFTAATAFGAPLGTVLADLGGWRLPMYGIAGGAVLVAAAIAFAVRGIPIGAPVTLRKRFATLGRLHLVAALAATLLAVCGFNIVYIFSSAITRPATGGSASALAVLLLLFGTAGIVGNALAGRLVDRFGSARVGVIAFAVDVAMLAILPFVIGNLIAVGVIFAVWGLSVNAATLPLQHRLVAIDPDTSAIALSWFSTALYAGIALAPVLGGLAFAVADASVIPAIGAVVTALALAGFALAHGRRRQRVAA